MGKNDRSLTLRFLKNYMSKTGNTIVLDYNKHLANDPGIIAANNKALKTASVFLSGGELIQAGTSEDLSTSVGRVMIQYNMILVVFYLPVFQRKYTLFQTQKKKISLIFL